VEYARCVLLIVKGKENDNDILEAAKILQEVQVETYGSMDRREKLEFILYQMKIMLKKEDFVRLFIISKKINEQNLGDDLIADIKILFYSYMAIYHNSMSNYLEAARCYRIIWATLKSTKQTIPATLDFGFSADLDNVIANYIGFLVLHPYSPETAAELKGLKEDEHLEKHAAVHRLICTFLSEEIVASDLQTYSLDEFELFRPSYKNHEVPLPPLRNTGCSCCAW
jgi:26S proteasome regulatory subunit N5